MNDDNNFSLASSKVLAKIPVDDLEIGMYVSKLDKPWLNSNFLFQGFELVSQADINAVKAECKHVFIDVEKQNKALKPKAKIAHQIVQEFEPAPVNRSKSSFLDTFDKAEDVHHRTSSLVKSFMDDVALGKGINVALAKQAVSECVEAVLQSPDAMLWMMQLKNRDLYTAQHSMNVCLLAILLGRQLNFSVDALNNVGLCGMMHDMGKMLVPLEVLNKPGQLDPEEKRQMFKHPEYGRNLLMQSRDMYPGAIDVAYSHHERLDGKGYPRKINGEGITKETRIVTIVDMYDAMTSDRVYQKGRTHRDAIDSMLNLRLTHLDPEYLIPFIRAIGLYPPGSVVEMTNGEIAVVMEVDPNNQIKPKVIICMDEDKKLRMPRYIDLQKLDLDANGKNYRIKRLVNGQDFGIDDQFMMGLQKFIKRNLQPKIRQANIA